MSNFFTEVVDDLDGLQQKLLGPDYKYYSKIVAPQYMGMSSAGNLGTMANDIFGMIAYTQLLLEGGGRASAVPGPLGDKFFLKTGAKCKDVATGEQVDRSLYINNVPDGSIPFISSGLGVQFNTFRGLLPGVMSTLPDINPLEIFQSFMAGTNPDCQKIVMETVDVNSFPSAGSGYVTLDDIKSMNPCWFPGHVNPVTKESRLCEGFTNLNSNTKKDISGKKQTASKIYITETSKIMTYVYLVSILIVICYFLSRLRAKR